MSEWNVLTYKRFGGFHRTYLNVATGSLEGGILEPMEELILEIISHSGQFQKHSAVCLSHPNERLVHGRRRQ